MGKLPPLQGPLPLAPASSMLDPLGFTLKGTLDRPTTRVGGPRPPRDPPPLKALRRLLSEEDCADPLGLSKVCPDAPISQKSIETSTCMRTLQLMPPHHAKRRSSKKPVLPPILE